ncbi:FAD-dependent oxidoreductase [Sphingosinicella sp. CPCC 101087]|uniref:FAD-dependent oxidoreductase n=1 Tax=Sphingosinicella sp. CPCC 101087 TaxID=2497754 RepID=UPI0019825694|nr:bifunctional TVP38/TMEM64 family protein/FAD-dependent oxidoreductase [Sphingosinicella sp. CPCC 101087]
MRGATAGRLVLALFVAAVFVAFFLLDLGDRISFDMLKARRSELAGLLAEHPLVVPALFFLFYVAATALSIPGAALLTLAAGAIFHFWLGLVIVSFAATTGASLAFLSSRYLFRDWVQRRFGARLKAIDRGIARDGLVYLLALRLNPAVPFFLVNLGMGLTRMPLPKFALVSQIGMLPATAIYVNAGTELAQIRSPGDIASPGLIGSLVLLSLFPLAGQWAARWLRRRRIYKGWRRPRRFDRNLIVIGAGSGGLVTAYIAAAVRAKVTLIEARKMGGDCLNTGCVPSKTLIRSARAAHEIRSAARFGIAAQAPQVDFPAVMRRIEKAIADIAPADSAERYTSLGVDVRLGHGRIVDPWTVEVNGARLTTGSIVIAAGALPIVPNIPGIAGSGYLTSDTLWEALAARETLPRRLAILGGGPIGVELAQAFARLGSDVTIVQSGPRLLHREDEDVAEAIAKILNSEGVTILTGHEAIRVEGKTVVLRPSGAEGEVALPYDELVVAIGRKPRLEGYGLETLGIDTQAPPDVNPWLETAYPNIAMVGDVAGSYQFTHAASHQAWHAAVNALFGGFKRFRVDYSVLPRVTFTDPEVAQVGHNVQSARAAGVSHEIVRFPLAHLDRAVAEGARDGWVQVLVRPGGDRILGATIVGHNAGELIAEMALAMKHRLGLGKLLGTVHAYPTMAEANKYAAGTWRRAHQPQRLLRWAEFYHRWRRR